MCLTQYFWKPTVKLAGWLVQAFAVFAGCFCRLWCPKLGSFGVVVLEIVSGLQAVDFRQLEVLVVKKVHEFEVKKGHLWH